MNFVATLIANPAEPALDAGSTDIARALLPQASQAVWLAPGVAADIPFSGDGLDPAALTALTDKIRAALGGRPFDVVVQPVTHRRKKLFLADMDSTMIG